MIARTSFTLLFAALSLWCSPKASAGDDVARRERREAHRAAHLKLVERENFDQLKVCESVLAGHMAERNKDGQPFARYMARQLVFMANLPAYAWNVNAIYFQYEMPGLRFFLEQDAYEGSQTMGTDHIRRFRVEYDPSKFSRLSVIRRTFGDQTKVLTREDIRFASETMMIDDEGYQLQIFLKGKNDDGGMIMISRDTGRIHFWPPGTDVDGVAAGVVSRSIKAVWGFGKGLAGELQNMVRKYTGQWYTDKNVIEVNE